MTPAVRKRFIQIGFLVLLQAVILFAASGRLDWSAAWVYLALYLALIGFNAILILPKGTELIEERAEIREGAKGWDKVIGLLTAIFGPAILLVAGLDERLGWPPQISPAAQIAAFVILALSYGLFSWAMASNRFFSVVVRIQKERGHTVETGGPYRFLRHPGYAGMLITYLSIPAALGSVWAYILAACGIIALIVRTALEDRTLLAELEGYQDYARQVRYRLVPGIW